MEEQMPKVVHNFHVIAAVVFFLDQGNST